MAHGSKQKRFKMTKKQVLALSAIVIATAAALLLIRFWENQHWSVGEEDTRYDYGNGSKEVMFRGSWYTEREDLETILVAGVDKYADQIVGQDTLVNYQQADFLVLLVLDEERQICKAIQINRDTMADVNYFDSQGNVAGHSYEQIALSHSYGTGGEDSNRNMVETVSNLLYGIRIDHYVVFTMDAVAKINDAVGGVPVEIRDDFSGVNDDWKIGDTVLLKGADALKYVRARGGMAEPTNLARMERQRQYLSAWRDTFFSKAEENEKLLYETFGSAAQYLSSDCSLEKLKYLFDSSADLPFELVTPNGTAELGEKYIEFTPDEEELQELVVSTFFEPRENDGTEE